MWASWQAEQALLEGYLFRPGVARETSGHRLYDARDTALCRRGLSSGSARIPASRFAAVGLRQ